MCKYARNIIALSTIGLAFLIAGCNTVKGFGQDMQSGGHAVEKAANNAKNS